MKVLISCCRAEFIKQKHTIFYPIHIGVPVIFILAVWAFAKTRGGNAAADQLLMLAFESIGIALPLLSAVICGLVCEREEQAGRCQNVLVIPWPRWVLLTAKMILVMSACAISMVLTTIGLAVVLKVPAVQIAAGSGLIWLGMLGIYGLNLFLGYRFGMGICGMMGFLGVIIAALANTGFMDQIWLVVPWTWAMRLVSAVDKAVPLGTLSITGVILLNMVLLAVIFRWYQGWEGANREE